MNKQKKDYYKILGVDKDTPISDIKKKFRDISKKYHPDLQTGKSEEEKRKSEEIFRDAAEAYETLSDDKKRQNYDNGGFDFDFGDTGGFGSFFGGGFPFNINRKKSTAENGSDIQLGFNITFKESIFGVKKEFDINLDEECSCCHGTGVEPPHTKSKCKICNGNGFIVFSQGNMITKMDCDVCNGTGEINEFTCKVCNGFKRTEKMKHFTFNIPAGVKQNQKFRMSNCGRSGILGGKNGDLYIILSIEKCDLFECIGNDITTTIYVSPIICALGGEIDVISPFGQHKLSIPIGTRTDSIFKIAGGGLKGTSGKLLVTVKQDTLTKLSEEQKNLLNKLNETITIDNLEKEKDLIEKIKKF